MNPLQLIPFLVFSIVESSIAQYPFPYDINMPSHTLELEDELQEISGIALSDDGAFLYAVQDEAGKIFTIEEESGDIEAEIDFWKDGDYEDLALVHGELFVLKSTGTIYHIQQLGQASQQVTKYNTVLEKRHNAEGLCYNPAKNCLLIGCKNPEDETTFSRAVYAFDLDKKAIHEQAIMQIDRQQVLTFLDASPTLAKEEKIHKFFKQDEFRFSPSAVAIHPLSGHIYILSAVGNFMLILDQTAKVLHIEKLKKKVHNHPEGLAFSPDGTLYISNEGEKDKAATIHRFDVN